MFKRYRIMTSYLCPTMLHIGLVSIFGLILSNVGVETGYESFAGIALIICGGISSAFWGIVYQTKHKRKSIKQIFIDFIDAKQPLSAYLLAFAFLAIDFAGVLICRGFKAENIWIPILLFLKAIAFGGIEEIGWRYTFQPAIEKKMPYIFATICTFLCWGIWHILFFYIDGSLQNLGIHELFSFMLGLFTLSFILSALYKKTGSLWICVMTHALVNTGAQLTAYDNPTISVITKLICILLAVGMEIVWKDKLCTNQI